MSCAVYDDCELLVDSEKLLKILIQLSESIVEYLFLISMYMKIQSVHTTKYNNGNWGTSAAKAIYTL